MGGFTVVLGMLVLLLKYFQTVTKFHLYELVSMLTCEEFIHVPLLEWIQLMLVEYVFGTELIRVVGAPPTQPQMQEQSLQLSEHGAVSGGNVSRVLCQDSVTKGRDHVQLL